MRSAHCTVTSGNKCVVTSKLKIAHWGKFYPPEWGGMEAVSRDLAVGYARAGHSVRAVVFTNADSRTDEDEGAVIVRCKVWTTIASQPLSLRWILKAVASASKADVVEIHAPNLLAFFPLLLVGRRRRIILRWQSDLVGKGFLATLAKPLERYMLRRAHCIIASSPMYAEASPRLSRYRGKVCVVANGISDPARVATDGLLPGNISSFLRGRKLVLAVGRLVSYKGFRYLVEAASELNEQVAVVIIGSGPLEAELQRQIEASDLNDKVLLAGSVSDEELSAAFANASLYVMSSIERSEAFGMVQVEAMAYGLPIVATRVPGSGVTWVSGEGATGATVPVRDASALAGAINIILDSARRFDCSREARKRFEEEFTADIMVARTLHLMTYDDRCVPPSASARS